MGDPSVCGSRAPGLFPPALSPHPCCTLLQWLSHFLPPPCECRGSRCCQSRGGRLDPLFPNAGERACSLQGLQQTQPFHRLPAHLQVTPSPSPTRHWLPIVDHLSGKIQDLGWGLRNMSDDQGFVNDLGSRSRPPAYQTLASHCSLVPCSYLTPGNWERQGCESAWDRCL